MSAHRRPPPRAWLPTADCDLDDFVALVEQTHRRSPTSRTPPTSCDNVLVYDADRLARAARRTASAVAAELVRALTDGPGVVVFRGAFPDTAVVDRATAAFDAMIADERAAGGRPATTSPSPAPTTGSGTRWRSWPSRDPETFVDYYANDIIALVSRGLARPRLPGHLAGQRRRPGRRRRRTRTATTTSASSRTTSSSATRPTSTCSPRC